MNIWTDLPKIPLPKLLSFVVDNRGKTVPLADDGNHILIATNCVRNERLYPSYEKVRYLSQETYDTWFRAHPIPGDILFVCKGTPGRVCMVPDPIDFCIAQDMVALRADESIIYNKYLLAILRSRPIQEQIANTSVGDVIPHFKKQYFDQLLIPVPDFDLQKKIGDFYYDFSAKIEMNERINDNLAEQSQAVLRLYMDSHPCYMKPLGGFANIIDCLHSKKPNSVTDTTKQLIQLNNILDTGFLDLTSKYHISESDYSNWTRKCEIVEGDCVITNVGRIGAVSQAPSGTHAAMGRNMTCVRLKAQYPYPAYLITGFLSPHIQTEIKKNTDEGTIMGALNVKNIPLLQFPFFDETTMIALEDTLYPLRKSIELNYQENQKLSLLRDTLLPRLMSGELDVSEIDI